MTRHNSMILVILLGFSLLGPLVGSGGAAPAPDLWPRWQTHDKRNSEAVDHSTWDRLLTTYVDTDHPSGIYRFQYRRVGKDDRMLLANYVRALERVQVSRLRPAQQKAYWINLYNARTVLLILEHYPVESIRDIDISPGWFSRGPWDAKLLVIEGQKVSLNDIEHRILRPIWQDNRVHYALNCASLGCPNLQPVAFTATNTEKLLDEAARQYINHPRGARLHNDTLLLSSIYKWFQIDFGGSEQEVLRHLAHFADKKLTTLLVGDRHPLDYDYDWGLNE